MLVVTGIGAERRDLGAEYPHGDLLQAILPIPFLVVWGLDSFFYRISTFPGKFIPLPIRLTLATISLGSAFFLMWSSHKSLFEEVRDPPRVIESGVFRLVRHPMYLGALLIYVGFMLATLSIISFLLWMGVFIMYDKMATYEEEDLVRIFGEEYLNYQRRVPKWIPFPSFRKR